jgi:hypothetical protein
VSQFQEDEQEYRRDQKRHNSADFVMALREKAVTPDVAQHTSGHRSAIDEG